MKNFTNVFPRHLDIELTNQCQSNCPMCPRDKLPSIGFMTDETFEKIFYEIKNSGLILAVTLSGMGEPFLHPNILKYIKALKSLKINLNISISTNAEKLTPDVFDKLNALLSYNDLLRINIQAVDIFVYNNLMIGLNFKRIMKNIDYIAKKKSTLNLRMMCIVHKANYKHLKTMRLYFDSKNIILEEKLAFTRCGNLIDGVYVVPVEKYCDSIPNCALFRNNNFIDWEGNIYPCSNDIKRVNPIGNIKKDSFYDISIRKGILIKKGLDFEICQMCDDYARYVQGN